MEEKAKVYFTDFRALPGTNLQKKLEKLMKKAGIENIDFELINSLYEKTKKEISNNKDEITPIEYLDKFKLG